MMMDATRNNFKNRSQASPIRTVTPQQRLGVLPKTLHKSKKPWKRQVGLYSVIANTVLKTKPPKELINSIQYVRAHYLEYPILAVVILSFLIPVLNPILEKDRYLLTHAASLLSKTPAYLQKNIAYDAKTNAYTFTPPASEQSQPNSQSIGGVKYSASLSTDAKQGISLTDTTNKLSISLTPQFDTQPAKQVDGHIVYPVSGADSQLVYTFKGNGLKEDIVLYSSPSDEAEFSYKLRLPTDLQARLQRDGSIGIFGGESSLYSNITYGTDADKDLVQKAKQKQAKNTLMYSIPAPIIKQANEQTSSVQAKFALSGDKLTINVRNLLSGQYPLTIDPSLNLASPSAWTAGNSDDANIDASNPTQISRASISGGSVGSWASGTYGTGGVSFLYNGHKYSIGAGNSNYTSIGSDGAGFLINNTAAINNPTAAGQYGNQDIVEYNGYAYAVGGVTITTNNAPCGGTLQPACTYTYNTITTVQYAKILPDGSLASWQNTSNLVGKHYLGGAFTYKGYIYAFNGYSPDGAAFGTTQYAKLNPDGTVGTWQTSATLTITNNIYGGTSLSVYNGYAYVTGGLGTGSNGQTNTEYAPVSGTGFGTWQTSSSMVQGVLDGSVAAYRGYIYSVGGCTNQSGGPCANNTNVVSTMQYAPIYANGQLGPWATSISPSEIRTGGTLMTYNSYLYISGGFSCSGVSGSCNMLNYYGDFQFAKIDVAGVATGSSGLADFTAVGQYWHSSIAYNGYLYVLGGTANGTIWLATTRMAKLNIDGTIGAWSSAVNTFANGRVKPGLIVNNGYLYVIGGYGACGALGATAYCNDIQYTFLSTSDGTPSSWTSQPTLPLPTATGFAATYTLNGFVYVTAGATGAGVVSRTYYNTLSLTGGVTGAWGTTQSLPIPYRESGVATNGKTVYIVGGTDNSNTVSKTIYYTTGTSTGLLNSWQSADPGNAPGSGWGTTRYSQDVFVNKGILYQSKGCASISSGNCANATNDLMYMALNSDGSPSTWTVQSLGYSTLSYWQSATVYNDFIYSFGGYQGSSAYKDTQYMKIKNGGGGTNTAWSSVQALPANRAWGAAAVVNGYLYHVGGCSLTDCGSSSAQAGIYYTKILSDGTLTNPWTAAANSMPAERDQGAITVVGNYLYWIGGASIASGINSTVYHTVLDPTSGAPGVWVTDSSLRQAIRGNTAVSSDGYIYVTDGSNGSSVLTTEYTYVGNGGGVPTDPGCGSVWCATTSLPTGAGTLFGAAAANGKMIYYTGGQLVGSAAYSNDMYYATLSSSGIGAWTKGANSFFDPRYEHVTIAENGYLYVIGGSDASGCGAYPEYAPILPNGDVGTWQSAPSPGRNSAAGAYGNGNLYYIGGQPCAAPITNVDVLPLQTVAAKATYSRLYMTDKDVTPVAASMVFTSGSGSIVGSTASAKSATPTFGSAVDLLFKPTNNNAQAGTTQSSYFYYSFNLDDTQSATWPDGQTNTAISYFRMSYHPNTSQRIRGGGTFNLGNKQSLDAP
jgi:hypothetical protein